MPSLLSAEVLERLPRAADSTRELSDSQVARRQMLLERAQHLDEPERTLLRLALKNRLSQREIAPLVGLNHGTVMRRLRHIKRRLADPMVVALLDPACPLPPGQRELALDYYLRRRAIRRMVQQHQLSWRELRRRIDHVRGWFIGRREGARITRAILEK